MGGYNSGNRRGAKTTVGECLWIDTGRWMREGILAPETRRTGRWIWWKDRSKSQESASIGYDIETFDDGTGFVRLTYSLKRSGETIDYRFGLQSTRPHLGGIRWWFTCPLVRGSRPCMRRCGKLYLPPGARYYGCRACHDLTYTSCQESHRWDAMWRTLGAGMGMHPRLVRRIMERQTREARQRREKYGD